MGLDISAYRKLTKLDVLLNEDGEPIDPATSEPMDDYFQVYDNPHFPGRIEGLKDRMYYSYAEKKHVFSRSYGGYNRWRETLAKMAGYPLDYYETTPGGRYLASHAAAAWNGKVKAGAPFEELVNFADNEGVIGPMVAAKLFCDFVKFDERAKTVTEDAFYQGYCALRHGLEMAADNGALEFH